MIPRVKSKKPMTTNLCFLLAIELAHKLREKEISAREVLSAHLAQIERVNPKVNAIVMRTNISK
jgi:amidase